VMNTPGIAEHVPAPMRADAERWKSSERHELASAQQKGQLGDAKLDEMMLAASCLVHGLAHMIVDGHKGFGGMTPDQAANLAHVVTGAFGQGLLPRPPTD